MGVKKRTPKKIEKKMVVKKSGKKLKKSGGKKKRIIANHLGYKVFQPLSFILLNIWVLCYFHDGSKRIDFHDKEAVSV